MNLVKLYTLLFMLLASLSLQAQIPTKGLVAWLPFTGNAVDSANGLNNGTVYGATLSADRFGSSNSSYYFDGNNDYIDLGLNSSIRSSSHSVNFWFRYVDTNKTSYILNSWNSLSGEWGAAAIHHQTFGLHYSVASGSTDRSMTHLSYSRLADNQWHMFTAVYDKNNNSLVMYLDNQLTGGVNYTGSKGIFQSGDSVVYKSGEHWILGAASQYFSSSSNNGPAWFKGYLDDVRMYNRSLKMAEVVRLFNGGGSCFDTTNVQVYDTTVFNTSRYNLFYNFRHHVYHHFRYQLHRNLRYELC